MASGLLGFLGFGRREKPNLTQQFRELPQADQAPLYNPIQDFARKRIAGENLGFGDNFVDKAGGPMATRMRKDFNDYTVPRLSSSASARGLGRSTLALDQERREGQENESNIDQLYADLFKLNEMQKKTDQQFGVGVGERLDSQWLQQGNQAAEAFNTAERGNTERTAGVAATNNANSLARQNQVIATMLGGINPAMAASWNAGSAKPTTPANSVSPSTYSQNSTKVNLPGASQDSISDITALLNAGMSIDQIMAYLKE